MNVLALFSNIRLFVLDIDGVLTDGTLLLLNDGQMARSMNIKDGYALQLAIKKGYRILAISGGSSEAAQLRLKKLGVEDVFINISNKKEVLEKYMAENEITREQTLYMGDDLPDMVPMQMVGLACCPANAATEIRYIAHYVSPHNGGQGCVRDVIEKVLKLNQHWNDDSHIASK